MAEKIAFPPKPDGQTYRRTDFNIHRVALLLKKSSTHKIKEEENAETPFKYSSTKELK